MGKVKNIFFKLNKSFIGGFMTFYIDEKNEKIIKNYKKENSCFIIEYLDGTKEYIKQTDTTEDDIHLKMIKQAIKRDREIYNEYSIRDKLNHFYKYFGFFTNGCSIATPNTLLYIITLTYTLLMQLECTKSNIQLKELKKYRMFLRLLNIAEEKNMKLEYIDNNNIQKPLNLNELDNISYNEFKKLDKAYKLIINKINKES